VQDLYQAWLCEVLQYGHHTILLDGDSNQILKAGFPMARIFQPTPTQTGGKQ
jgi:hypothetical protein